MKKRFTILILMLWSLLGFSQQQLPPEIRTIVDSISNSFLIQGSSVDFVGYKPTKFKSFERLIERTNEKLLIELMNDTSLVIKGYAFWGLLEKDSPKVWEIYEKNSADSSKIMVQFGCPIYAMTMNDFYRERLMDYAILKKIDVPKAKYKQYPIIKERRKEWKN